MWEMAVIIGRGSFGEQSFLRGPVQAFQTVTTRQAPHSLGSITAQISVFLSNGEKQEFGISLHVNFVLFYFFFKGEQQHM